MSDSSISSISCNRKAFASDEECNRGSVDISQFDDLPFCETINPGRSEIPPEILDTPLDLTIPPPCTCVNVDYKLGAKWSSAVVFGARGSFKAKGDCCEGNYVSNLDLSIPCPIPYDGVYTTVRKKWVDQIQDDVVQLIKNVGDCSLGINDIDLSIPCPIKDVNGKISASVSYGTGNGTASTVIASSSGDCGVNITGGSLDLSIPCPVKDVNGQISASVSYGTGNNTASTVIASSSGDCGINITGGSLDLSIPCPIPYDTGYTTIRKKWVEQIQDDEVTLIKNVGDCSLAVNDIDLSVPCPIPKFGYATVNKEWADSLKADRVKLISREGDCSLSVNDFSLSIPCPRVRIRKIDVGVSTAWGKRGTGSASFTMSKKECNFSIGGKIDVYIPCPSISFYSKEESNTAKVSISSTGECGSFQIKSEASDIRNIVVVSDGCSNVSGTGKYDKNTKTLTLTLGLYYS